jgi:hypothetical protein
MPAASGESSPSVFSRLALRITTDQAIQQDNQCCGYRHLLHDSCSDVQRAFISLGSSEATLKLSIARWHTAIDRSLQEDLRDLVRGQAVVDGATHMDFELMRPVEP